MANDLTLPERVAVLETEWDAAKDELVQIKEKLDELLHLKSKGVGAFWFVSILIGSGLVGIFSSILSIFNNKPHL